MEKKEIIESHGVLTIRPAKQSELKETAKLLRSSFSTHNLFEKPAKEIVAYLSKARKDSAEDPIKAGVIVASIKEGKKQIIVGAMLVSLSTISKKQLHAVWKYKHIVVSEKYRHYGVGTKVMQYADNKIKELITKGKLKTAKIEISVSENEKESIPFYEKSGFHVEATLNNHYRYNEPGYILSKLISVENKEE